MGTINVTSAPPRSKHPLLTTARYEVPLDTFDLDKFQAGVERALSNRFHVVVDCDMKYAHVTFYYVARGANVADIVPKVRKVFKWDDMLLGAREVEPIILCDHMGSPYAQTCTLNAADGVAVIKYALHMLRDGTSGQLQRMVATPFDRRRFVANAQQWQDSRLIPD